MNHIDCIREEVKRGVLAWERENILDKQHGECQVYDFYLTVFRKKMATNKTSISLLRMFSF